MRLQPLALRIARVLLIQSLRPALRRALPAILRAADVEVPQALARGAAPIVVEGLLVQAVRNATGLQPSSAETQVLGTLFDVVASAAAQQLIRR